MNLAALTPEQFQNLALAWLGTISVVGAAFSALIVKNWSAISKAIIALAQLRAQVRTHAEALNLPTTPPPASSLPAHEEAERVTSTPPPAPTRASPLIVALLLPALLFSGCAATKRTFDKSGNPNWNIQGNYAQLDIQDHGRAGFNMHAVGVDHSTPTLAQGSAAANVVGSVGAAGSGLLLSAGSSGLFPKAVGAAAPVVTSWMNSRTPAPAALQAK